MIVTSRNYGDHLRVRLAVAIDETMDYLRQCLFLDGEIAFTHYH